MKLIRCQKCGTTVVTDETFLQNILDALEDVNRKALHCPPQKRNVYQQIAAEYRTMFKSFMHNLSRRQEAENRSMHILGTLRRHILDNGLMTEQELAAVYAEGERKAAAAAHQADREIQAIYGNFDTICNRTMPNPTERAALKNLR